MRLCIARWVTHGGARGGVLDATVTAMGELGVKPSNIVAVVGPCIAQRSYEVGPEFPAPFLAEDPSSKGFFGQSLKPDHYLFDLSHNLYICR